MARTYAAAIGWRAWQRIGARMADDEIFQPLPSDPAQVKDLRQWNLEMLDAWYRKKDRYIREYNLICRWGDAVNEGGGAGVPPRLQQQVMALTYSPVLGAPDRRLCHPQAWFMLVEKENNTYRKIVFDIATKNYV